MTPEERVKRILLLVKESIHPTDGLVLGGLPAYIGDEIKQAESLAYTRGWKEGYDKGLDLGFKLARAMAAEILETEVSRLHKQCLTVEASVRTEQQAKRLEHFSATIRAMTPPTVSSETHERSESTEDE